MPSYGGSATLGNGDFYRGTFDVNQPITDSVAVRLNGMVMDAGVVDRDHTHIQRLGLAPSIAVGLGGPTRLMVSYFHFQDHNKPDYGLPYLFGEPAPVATLVTRTLVPNGTDSRCSRARSIYLGRGTGPGGFRVLSRRGESGRTERTAAARRRHDACRRDGNRKDGGGFPHLHEGLLSRSSGSAVARACARSANGRAPHRSQANP